tara:strand:+ start:516 stop:767 length:252 start_codon:yes stop_codon:yes gene_type:complete
MKLEIPITILEEIQICNDHFEESIERYRYSQKIINDQHQQVQKLLVEGRKEWEEENIAYLEDHDWHIYKSKDWIQDLEESDWA